MTIGKQGQKKHQSKSKPNRTPAKGSRYQQKKKSQSSQPVLVKRTTPANEYLCTACDRQVFKKPVGYEIEAKTKNSPGKKAGLGRWKCGCGNTKVSVKRVRAVVAEVKKAA